MKFWMKALFLGTIAAGAALFFGCGSSSSGSYPTFSYGGPGSAWTATLNADGTFSITHAASPSAAVDMTVSGTYTRLSTGFVKLTVVSATGTGAPVAGDIAHALEVPGFAFLLKPAGSESNMIPMVVSGTCPTADLALNWIASEKDDTVDATSIAADFYGTFAYTAATNSATLPAKYALAGPATALGSGTVGTLGTCANSIMTFTGGAMWMTSLGGALVHADGGGSSSDQTIVAMPTTAVTTTTALAGDYAGLVFNKHSGDGSGSRLFPISGTATAPTSTTLAMVGSKLSDVETGATTGDTAALLVTGIDSPSSGFMQGTVTVGGSTGLMACMAAKNVVSSGKNMIFCIAQSPGHTTEIFSVLLVSK